MSSIRVLKTFLAVAAEGSFAAAAGRVSLTQAAVGQQMRTLEADLRRALFTRQGKAVALNDAGNALVPTVRRIVQQYEQMLATPQPHEAMSGTVHLGAVVSAVRALLRATLALKERHPGLQLHVSAAKSIELLARVQSGELDAAIAVRESAPAQPGLAWTPLYTEPMVLLTHRGVPPAPLRTLLQRHPFIRFDQSEHTGRLVERVLRKLRVKPQQVLELNAIETIVELVRSEMGVAILPQLQGSRWHSDAKLRVVAIEGTLRREIALVHPRGSAKAGVAAALAREFQQER